MSAPEDMAERHARTLAELGELGLGLARRLQEEALAAEDPKVAAELGAAFHRVARTVRQTLALEAKLARDHLRAAVEARAEAVHERDARIAERKVRLHEALEPHMWAASEDDLDVEQFELEFEERLEREALLDSFADEPFEAQVERLRLALGLPEERAVQPPPPYDPWEARNAAPKPGGPPPQPNPPSSA